MLELTVNLSAEEAYRKVKESFLSNRAKLLREDAHLEASFRQGSLWGVTPKTAKKTVKLTLAPTGSTTQIICQSRLSSDWKNVTLVGCVFAFVLAAVCAWIAADLGGALSSGYASFWSWLITAEGNLNSGVGAVFVKLVGGLAGFLFVVITVEAAIVVYVQKRLDAFASEVLNLL